MNPKLIICMLLGLASAHKHHHKAIVQKHAHHVHQSLAQEEPAAAAAPAAPTAPAAPATTAPADGTAPSGDDKKAAKPAPQQETKAAPLTKKELRMMEEAQRAKEYKEQEEAEQKLYAEAAKEEAAAKAIEDAAKAQEKAEKEGRAAPVQK